MDEKPPQEKFDTGLIKIKHEIKTLLVTHGLFGSVSNTDIAAAGGAPQGTSVGISVKGRTVDRPFTREQIEDCRLRVSPLVLTNIRAMVDELAAPPPG